MAYPSDPWAQGLCLVCLVYDIDSLLGVLCRRTAGAKFVPPIKQDESGGSGSSFTSHVTSKVMSHGGPSSEGGAGCLPPELEGNERLRNIEPRMVELILNEVTYGVLILATYYKSHTLASRQ